MITVGPPPDPKMDQMERLIAVLERIAEVLEDEHEGAAYMRAIERWKLGQRKHPDD